jgi:hypothetical protein
MSRAYKSDFSRKRKTEIFTTVMVVAHRPKAKFAMFAPRCWKQEVGCATEALICRQGFF